jgi:hypothetical protein
MQPPRPGMKSSEPRKETGAQERETNRVLVGDIQTSYSVAEERRRRRYFHRFLKPWHALVAWLLVRRIRRQHRELAKYIRRSAYEIAAWKQDIGFLDEQRRYHLSQMELVPPRRPTRCLSDSMARIQKTRTQGRRQRILSQNCPSLKEDFTSAVYP